MTIVNVLEQHSAQASQKIVYRYLENGEDETKNITYRDLYESSSMIAIHLDSKGLKGERVLLLVQEGIEFIQMFLACLIAGVIPVPASVPRSGRSIQTLIPVACDAQIKAIVANRNASSIRDSFYEECKAEWIFTDTIDEPVEAISWERPELSDDDIAFIQYTSGSTGQPKGVVVTHGNLIDNQKTIQIAMALTEHSVIVNWLPLYHDMGLIGSVLQPLYLGASCVLMPPATFIQKPVRWLKAITKYRATTTGGPNFAYDLCIKKISDDQLDGINLESLTLAFSGAEPVRASTVEIFYEKFSKCGFKKKALFPCYGMAEATLFISGVLPSDEPCIIEIDSGKYAAGVVEVGEFKAEKGKRLVGCGKPVNDTEVIIVDDSGARVASDGLVGEIWVRGGGVAAGYYENPDLSQDVFGGQPVNEEETYLKTGDLGFWFGGELYISGRLKDVIIVRGKNHYPQDIEMTASGNDELLVVGGSAAFLWEDQADEKVIIVQELTRQGWRSANEQVVVGDIKEKVAREHGLKVFDVALIKPGTLPRTTSGKVRRSFCRNMYMSGVLDCKRSSVELGEVEGVI